MHYLQAYIRLQLALILGVLLTITISTPVYATDIPRFGKFETIIPVDTTYTNPYDPEEIDIQVIFTSPSGKTYRIPAFWYQAYDNETDNPIGGPEWRVRFSPSETGNYDFTSEIVDKSGKRSGVSGSFLVVESNLGGFIKISPTNSHYFVDSRDNRTFYPVGHNVECCDIGQSFKDVYPRAFSHMSEAGLNFSRIFLGPVGSFSLETGLPAGHYDQKKADNLDQVLTLAETHNIYLDLAVDWLPPASNPWLYDFTWTNNPYSLVNGGPLNTREDFWTDSQAKKLYRQRLRYLIARYSYSRSIAIWEVMNEANSLNNYTQYIESIRAWASEMLSYIQDSDPHSHLTSISYSNSRGDQTLNLSPELSVVMTHNYANLPDYAQAYSALSSWYHTLYNKPNFITEFGLDGSRKTGLDEADTRGIHLTTAIWGALFGGASGTPLSWHWTNYLDPQGHYDKYTGLTKYLRDVDLAGSLYIPREATLVSNFSPSLQELSFKGTLTHEYGKTGPDDSATTIIKVNVTRKGVVENSGRLFKAFCTNSYNYQTIVNTDFSESSTFTVFFFNKIGNPTVKVWLDDIQVSNNSESPSDRFVTIVPPGPHTLRVGCIPDSQVTVTRIEPSYQFETILPIPPLKALALVDQTKKKVGDLYALIWIRQIGYTNLHLVTEGKSLVPVSGSRLNLPGIPPGDYRIEWWSTTTGTLQSSVQTTVNSNTIDVEVPTISTDLAAKLYIISPRLVPLDLTGDGILDDADSQKFAEDYGKSVMTDDYVRGDFDGSGRVDLYDFSLFFRR